jgi:hypothetical protein
MPPKCCQKNVDILERLNTLSRESFLLVILGGYLKVCFHVIGFSVNWPPDAPPEGCKSLESVQRISISIPAGLVAVCRAGPWSGECAGAKSCWQLW